MAFLIWLGLLSGDFFVKMFTHSSTTDGCYQLCVNQGFLSNAHMQMCHVRLQLTSLLLRRSWSWFLERKSFSEGSFPARRKNWMEFAVRKKWALCSWLEYLGEVVHAEIDRRVKLAAEGCFSMRHPVVLVSSCWLPSLSDLGFVSLQWWLNSRLSSKVYSLQVLYQSHSLVFHFL